MRVSLVEQGKRVSRATLVEQGSLDTLDTSVLFY